MISMYTIANWITGCFEAYYLYILFETFLKNRISLHRNIYYLSVIIMAVMINISNTVFSIGVFNLALMIIIGFGASFIYKGGLKVRITASVFGVMISAITETITLFALSVLFDKNVNLIIENGYLRLIGIAISKISGYIVIKYIIYRVDKNKLYMTTNYWLVFFLVFLSSTLTMCTFCKILETGTSEYARNMIIVCSIGLCFTTILILFLYEKNLKQQEELTKQQFLQSQLSDQIKHYNDLMMSQEQVRATKHDLNNHLIAIRTYINNNDSIVATDYINQLLNELDIHNSFFDTGNTILDAMLSVKKNKAEHQGIKFTAKLIIPAKLPIDDTDICIIFGNILDNAIEACEKVTNLPYISVELIYGEDTLFCKIENSCINNGSNNQITTKEDIANHGIGKMNIQHTLENYSSIYDIQCSDGKYILTIMFMNLHI